MILRQTSQFSLSLPRSSDRKNNLTYSRSRLFLRLVLCCLKIRFSLSSFTIDYSTYTCFFLLYIFHFNIEKKIQTKHHILVYIDMRLHRRYSYAHFSVFLSSVVVRIINVRNRMNSLENLRPSMARLFVVEYPMSANQQTLDCKVSVYSSMFHRSSSWNCDKNAAKDSYLRHV